jgi:hypothetical protein
MMLSHNIYSAHDMVGDDNLVQCGVSHRHKITQLMSYVKLS